MWGALRSFARASLVPQAATGSRHGIFWVAVAEGLDAPPADLFVLEMEVLGMAKLRLGVGWLHHEGDGWR
jgi:hypothetical protein